MSVFGPRIPDALMGGVPMPEDDYSGPSEDEILRRIGPEPSYPELPEPEFETSPYERVLEGFARQGTPQMGRAPRNFWEGLVVGGVQGLAGRGAEVATRRQRFDERQAKRRLLYDDERRKAGDRYKDDKRDAIKEAFKEHRTAKEKKAADDLANPINTPELIAKYPPLKALPLGERIPSATMDRVRAQMVDPKKPEKAEAPFKADDLASLTRQLTSDPAITKEREIQFGYGLVNRGAQQGNGPGDIMLLFGFMKMVDPNSTVREGEFATAQNAQGVPERVRQKYNQLMAGDLLGPAAREEYRIAAESMVGDIKPSADIVRNRVRRQAAALGIPEHLLFDPEAAAEPKPKTKPFRPGKAGATSGSGKGNKFVVESEY